MVQMASALFGPDSPIRERQPDDRRPITEFGAEWTTETGSGTDTGSGVVRPSATDDVVKSETASRPQTGTFFDKLPPEAIQQLFGNMQPMTQPEVEEGPSWFERQLKGASRTGGIMLGTAYALGGMPFAMGVASVGEEEEFKELPWYEQYWVAMGAGFSNTWDAMTKPGTFGITWGDYYKTVTGKELHQDLTETFARWGVPDPVTLANQLAPTIETMVEIAGDQLLWQGSAARQLMLKIPKNFMGKLGTKESAELVQQLRKLNSIEREAKQAGLLRKELDRKHNIFNEIRQKYGQPKMSFDDWVQQGAKADPDIPFVKWRQAEVDAMKKELGMHYRSGAKPYGEGFKPGVRSGAPVRASKDYGKVPTRTGTAAVDRAWREEAIASMKRELFPPQPPPRSGAVMFDDMPGFKPEPLPTQRTVHHARPVRREAGEVVRGTPPPLESRPPDVSKMIEPAQADDLPDNIRYAYERTAKWYELRAEAAADSGTDALTFLHRERKNMGISRFIKADPTAAFRETLDDLSGMAKLDLGDMRQLIPDEMFDGMVRVYGEGPVLDALSAYAGRSRPGFGQISNVSQLEKVLTKFRPGQTLKGVGQVLYLDRGQDGRVMVALKDAQTGKVRHAPVDEVLKQHRASEPSVTLDMLGFQQIWDGVRSWLKDFSEVMKTYSYRHPNYYDHMATPDAQQVVKQRAFKDGSIGPGVIGAERNVMMNIVEPDSAWIAKKYFKGEWFENAVRIFDELDPTGRLKKLFFWPMIEAEDIIVREKRMWKQATKNWRKDLKKAGSDEARKMVVFAIGEQDEGLQRLAQAGITKKVGWDDLSKQAQDVYLAMREAYDNMFHRLNAARKLAGKAEIKYEKNYFTFANDMNEVAKAGENIAAAPLTRLHRYLSPRTGVGFPYEKLRMPAKGRQAQLTRLGKEFAPLELDPIRTFDRYVNSAVDVIHKQPHIARMNELLGTFDIRDAAGKVQKWALRQTHPHAARFLREFTDFNSGFKYRWFFEDTLFDKAVTGLTHNLTASILGANLRSALIQPTAIRNTWTFTSTKDTAGGIKDYIESIGNAKKRKFIETHSRSIKAREADVAISDIINKSFRPGLLGKVGEKWNTAGKASLLLLQKLDNATAQASWWAGYRYAQRHAGKLGLKTTKDFTRYADDVVMRTQASSSKAVRSKVQRHMLGRALTLFQTFVINDMNMLIKDVLGVRNVKMTHGDRALRLFKYMFSGWMINMFYEDWLNVNSPLPTPIRAFNEAYEKGSDYPSFDGAAAAAKEIASGFPVLSFMRWGGSLAGAVGTTVEDIAKGDISAMISATGLPGTSQIRKAVRADERGDTLWAHLAGKPTPPPPKWESGWKGGGMDSGWNSGWD